jgi:small subunit ribosomal protein S1
MQQANKPPEEIKQDDDSFATLFEASSKESRIKEGEIVKGTVIKVTKDAALVDIGFKSEGIVPIHEFADPGGRVKVSEGDIVEVLLERWEDEDGNVIISKYEADKMRVWDEISDAYKKGDPIDGTITQKIKGGLSVTIRGGVKAFLPGSQIDLKPPKDLDQYLNRSFPFTVLKFNKKRGNIVLSRRSILEKQREELRSQTLGQLREGTVVEGVVKNITEYGAFVDLGGVDGLVHITDMSWGRINHPKDIMRVGDRIKVVVLKYDTQSEKVSLGIKQLKEDPWLRVSEKYPKTAKVPGRITMISDYGIFVEIEEGVEGLVHVSEVTWSKKVKNPLKQFKPGEQIEAVVLDIDAESRKIALGIKQLEPDPWTLFTEKHRPGDKISGKVRTITDYGAFVEIMEGIDGLVHKSDLSWTQKINHPSDFLKKGQTVDAVILNINYQDKKVSLGVKQLTEDPWERIPRDYPLGSILEVKVTKVTDFGAFVEIEKGIEGLIHISEMKDEPVKDPAEVVKEGGMVRAEVITVDPNERKIALSMKTVVGKEEIQNLEEFRKAQAAVHAQRPASTIGELIKQKMGDQILEVPKETSSEGGSGNRDK